MSDQTSVTAHLQGTIVSMLVEPGDRVHLGSVVALIESMKMHHEIVASSGGVVSKVLAPEGTTVVIGEKVVELDPVAPSGADLPPPSGAPHTAVEAVERAGDAERADLAEVRARHAAGLDP
ncbi:acetyl-CoA carboxylase biotin carboxyl carrier protein subunit, partial [Ilumatobacter sp.]|uniref:acetyl-CoA carboxylase biotin carboxyl carrier protein subunit n=1 Tax=Ilumatobacter sp. TaxID=1967498 RepID=UPI003C3AB47F